MKLYLHQNGVFYERQADCPSSRFETFEFPFSASPKSEFVAWMNQNYAIAKAAAPKSAEEPVLPMPEGKRRWRVFFKGVFAGVVLASNKAEALGRANAMIELKKDETR